MRAGDRRRHGLTAVRDHLEPRAALPSAAIEIRRNDDGQAGPAPVEPAHQLGVATDAADDLEVRSAEAGQHPGLALAQSRRGLLGLECRLPLDHPELDIGRDELPGQRVDLFFRRPHPLTLGAIVQRREELTLPHRLAFVHVQRHHPRSGLRGERGDASFDPAARRQQSGRRTGTEP